MNASLKDLKGKLDRQLVNPDAFKEANRVERIMMVMVAGPRGQYELTEAEREYAGLLEDAYVLIKEQRSQSMATKMMRDRLTKNTHRRYSALQVMRDAVNLFGRFEKINRPIQRGIIRDALLLRVKACEDFLTDADSGDKNAPLWEKLLQGYWKNLANLDDVSKLEEAGERDNTLPRPQFTTNPAALVMDSMAEDAQID